MKFLAELLASGDYYLDEKDKAGQKSAIEEVRRTLSVDGRHHMHEARRRYNIGPEDFIHEATLSEEDLANLPDGGEIVRQFSKPNTDYIKKAKTSWRRRFVVKPEPFGLFFVGDPHLDNKGCNLEALERDLELARAAKLRAVQMGDILDFFHKAGRLADKQAANRMTKKEGLAAARWLVRDTGMLWDAQLLGNHDAWAGDEFEALVSGWAREASKPHKVFNWMCELTYDWGDGEFRVLAAHDFKGSSVYNSLHSHMKRAMQDGTADLYVAGHRHTAAKGDEENGFRERFYHYLRVKGYKDWDEYAFTKGFPQQEEGRSAVAVIDPLSETKEGRCRTFLDVADGVEWLNLLRSRKEALCA